MRPPTCKFAHGQQEFWGFAEATFFLPPPLPPTLLHFWRNVVYYRVYVIALREVGRLWLAVFVAYHSGFLPDLSYQGSVLPFVRQKLPSLA